MYFVCVCVCKRRKEETPPNTIELCKKIQNQSTEMRVQKFLFRVCVCVLFQERKKKANRTNERKNYFNDSKCFAYRTREQERKNVPGSAMNSFQLLWKRVIATRQQNTAGKANENEISYLNSNNNKNSLDIFKWRESEIRLNATNQRKYGNLVVSFAILELFFFVHFHLNNIIKCDQYFIYCMVGCMVFGFETFIIIVRLQNNNRQQQLQFIRTI